MSLYQNRLARLQIWDRLTDAFQHDPHRPMTMGLNSMRQVLGKRLLEKWESCAHQVLEKFSLSHSKKCLYSG